MKHSLKVDWNPQPETRWNPNWSFLFLWRLKIRISFFFSSLEHHIFIPFRFVRINIKYASKIRWKLKWNLLEIPNEATLKAQMNFPTFCDGWKFEYLLLFSSFVHQIFLPFRFVRVKIKHASNVHWKLNWNLVETPNETTLKPQMNFPIFVTHKGCKFKWRFVVSHRKLNIFLRQVGPDENETFVENRLKPSTWNTMEPQLKFPIFVTAEN
jgi:hypothetical protein